MCKDKPTCSHCGIVGHAIEKCHKIYGFPPGFKFTRNKFIDGSKSSINPFVNQVQTDENPPFPFSQTQYQQLMTFMQNNNLAHSTLPAAHQVGSIPNHDHLFAKLLCTSQLPNSLVSISLNPTHSTFSSSHESFLSKVSQVSTLNT
jgi:hypothetical protein